MEDQKACDCESLRILGAAAVLTQGHNPGRPGPISRWQSEHEMVGLFAPIEPYETGMLDVGDGQHLYWETSGNHSGLPVVVLHGGAGSGSTPSGRRVFDPARYRIVQFDQRGCGRSAPRVDAMTDLSTNTTGPLIADIERLRRHLGIERWVVRGLSWGVTLGLAYAEAHPERVIGAVFSSVTMTRPEEIRWLYHDAGRFRPQEWASFRASVAPVGPGDDLVAAYYRRLNVQPDPEVRFRAAAAWCAWEDAISPLPGGRSNERYRDPSFRMTFARIVTHYFHHSAWLEPDQLLDRASRLAGIPGALIHGRLDLGGPLDTAWQLAKAWSDAQLTVVDTGHTGGEKMTAAIVEATTRFAHLS